MQPNQELKWKVVRGQKGVFWTILGRGSLVKDTAQEAWFFSVGRGIGDSGGDRWGPLNAAFDDEAAAVSAATRLERQLDRAGWFALTKKDDEGWSGPEMDACLAKLPRQVIPDYFLSGLDEAQAAAGLARKGNVLRVGGVDVHRWESSAVDAGMYLDTEATLVFTPPGQKPLRSNKDAFWLRMGCNGFEALIAYLLEIRAGLATEGAFQASAQEIIKALPGDFDGPDALRSRFERIVKMSANINDMFARLFALSPANLATLFMILDTMERGDRITGLQVTADDGSADAVVEVLVSSDSVTAATLEPKSFAVDAPKGTVH